MNHMIYTTRPDNLIEIFIVKHQKAKRLVDYLLKENYRINEVKINYIKLNI